MPLQLLDNEVETGSLFQNLASKLKQVTGGFVPKQPPAPPHIVATMEAARKRKKPPGRLPFLTPAEIEEIKRHPGEKSKGAIEFAKGIARDLPRSVASLYIAAEGRKQLIPETLPEKFLFGKEPVRRPQEEGTMLLKALGVKEKSAKRYGGAVGYPLAILGAIPFMPGKKQVAKEVAEQLAKRYGDDVAKLIIEKGGKDLAELALREGGENVVQRAGVTLAGRAVQAEARVPVAGVKTRPDLFQLSRAGEYKSGILTAEGAEPRRVAEYTRQGFKPELLKKDPVQLARFTKDVPEQGIKAGDLMLTSGHNRLQMAKQAGKEAFEQGEFAVREYDNLKDAVVDSIKSNIEGKVTTYDYNLVELLRRKIIGPEDLMAVLADPQRAKQVAAVNDLFQKFDPTIWDNTLPRLARLKDVQEGLVQRKMSTFEKLAEGVNRHPELLTDDVAREMLNKQVTQIAEAASDKSLKTIDAAVQRIVAAKNSEAARVATVNLFGEIQEKVVEKPFAGKYKQVMNKVAGGLDYIEDPGRRVQYEQALKVLRRDGPEVDKVIQKIRPRADTPKDIVAKLAKVGAKVSTEAKPTPAVTPIEAAKIAAPKKIVVPRDKTLKGVDAEIQERAAKMVEDNPDELIAKYKARNENVLNTDEARELFPDYAPGGPGALDDATKSARSLYSRAVHEPSSKLINEMYVRDLAEKAELTTHNNWIVFIVGATGSGKSTAIRSIPEIQDLADNAAIVYDTNLARFSSAKNKINAARKAGYKVAVVYVHREPEKALLEGALPRAGRMGRTVPLKDQVGTHVGCPSTFDETISHYADDADVIFRAVDNTGPAGAAKLTPLDNIRRIRYDESVLKDKLNSLLEDTYAKGEITETVYRGTKGDVVQGVRGLTGPRARGELEPERLTGTGRGREAKAGIQAKFLPTGADDAVTVERKIVSQQFRGDKLNLPTDQLAEIEKRRQALGLTTREVRTFGDMEEAAKELGTDVKTLLRDTAGKRLVDKEVVALRNLINTNSQRLVELEHELLENPAKETVLKMQMSIANQQVDEALKKLIKGGTESGRSVAAFRIMAQRTLEPDIWFRQAQRVLGEKELTNEMKAAIVGLIKDKDFHGLATFVSALRNPTFAERAIALWKAGLLTSPTTHLANIFGNFTMAALQTASDTLATGFDILASLATHKRSITVSSATVAARARGLIMGSREAREFLRTGVYSMDLMRKYDLPRVVAFKNKFLRGYTNAIFRSLGAEDIFFRQAAMGESFVRQAEVMALNEGLRGPGFKERIRFLLQNPTNGMVVKAIDDAEYVTFQSKNVLADLISGAKRGVRGKGIAGEAAAAATEFVAPFVKTPTNIAARIADYSPLGFIRALTGIARPATRSQEAFVRQLGRAVTGSTVMAFGAYFAEKGLLTGNAPTKTKERDMFYAEGKQPHSIRLGGTWYQLNRLSPFGNLLALGADFHEQDKDEGGTALISGTVAAGLKGLTEQTFLKGVSGSLKALTEPERSAKKFVQQSVASAIPTIISRVARTFDPTLRVPDTVLQSVQERLPYFRKQLPVRRDIFGEPVKSPSGRLALIDPFGAKPAVDDQLINEARRLGVAIGVPTQTISGTKLDNAEFSFYQKVQGRILRQYLTALYQSPEYQAMSSADQEKEFEGVLKDVRDQINDTVFPALMIKRYDLPNDTNPEVIREVLNSLNKDDRFKNLDRERQATAIKEVIRQVTAGVK